MEKQLAEFRVFITDEGFIRMTDEVSNNTVYQGWLSKVNDKNEIVNLISGNITTYLENRIDILKKRVDEMINLR